MTPEDVSVDGEVDAVCIGETMVAFVGTADSEMYLATTAGSASNVAVGLARLGLRTRWVSRIGDDPLGRFVEETLAGSGVDLAVVRDPSAPTGVMVKHPAGSEKISQYYRSESAARHLSREDLERVGSTRWIHVTGITPSLSSSALELTHAVIQRASDSNVKVSFDFNYRASLWPSASTAAEVLLPIARGADVVFIGDDEAIDLFGFDAASSLADLLLRGDDQELLLKRGSRHASLVMKRGELEAPALATPTADVTGAGDAFAAGYLGARSLGWPPLARLRLGHLMASRVVQSIKDIPDLFDADELAQLSPASLAVRWEEVDDAPGLDS
jgi:2-dehydro-3-deoxygluconokinase